MFVQAQSRQYRYQGGVTAGVRPRGLTPERGMSVALRKAVVIALGAALVLVFAVSQVFYWEIMESHKAVTELRTTISLTSQESVALLAARDRLLSPQRIKAVAAAKLDLHVPNKKLQVHSF